MGDSKIFEDFVARWETVEELGVDEHLVVDTDQAVENTNTVLRPLIRL